MPIFPKNPTSNEVISIGSKNWKFNSTDGVWDKIGGSDPAVVGSTFDHVDNGITLNGETLSVDTTATIELVGIAHAGDANTKLVFGTDTVNIEAGGYRGISMNSSTVEVGGVTLGAGGITLGDSTNITSALRTDSYTGHIETAADKTYTIDPAAATARTITAFFIKSASGTVTATLKNGSDTIKAASVSDSSGAQSSLANTSVAADGVITIVTSSNSSALDVIFGIDYTS
tara:strand:+ start:7568 stop:8257 length:690 start_codon:yes stop_codon:yes gene_type:complete